MELNTQPKKQSTHSTNISSSDPASGTTGMSHILVGAFVFVALAAAGVYFYMNTNAVQIETTILNSETASTSDLTLVTTTHSPTATTSKVITCNPKKYDPTYFSKQKPCVIDMIEIDKEREASALRIIKETKTDDEQLKSLIGSLIYLIVSMKNIS